MPRWLDEKIESYLGGLGYTKARPKAITSLFGGDKFTIESSWEGWTESQYERLAVTSAWVFSDVSLISNTIKSIPLGVYRKEGEGMEEMINHPFENLLESPNPHMDQVYLMEYLSWWYLLRGEAYMWLVKDKAGELVELWPIPSEKMRPIPDPQKYIAGYAYRAKSGWLPLRAEDVCFIRRPNPFDFHRGLSPITGFRLALQSDTSAAEYNRDTYDNELMLKMLINLPQETSDPVFQNLKTELVTELRDRQKRFWIGRAGDVDVTEIGMSQRDAEFLASREFSRTEIDRVYGIPEGFWSASASRANSDAAQTTFIESAVWPQTQTFSGAFTTQIVRPYYGDDLRGKFADTRPKDRRLLVQEYRQYWMVKTVNEARKDLGMKPLEDDALGNSLVPQVTYQKGVPISTVQQPTLKLFDKEIAEDLRRWKSIAVRRFRKSEEPYNFESEYLNNETIQAIQNRLAEADSEKEIKAIFEQAKDSRVTTEDLAGTRKMFADLANG